jgi:hypothetical protein
MKSGGSRGTALQRIETVFVRQLRTHFNSEGQEKAE